MHKVSIAHLLQGVHGTDRVIAELLHLLDPSIPASAFGDAGVKVKRRSQAPCTQSIKSPLHVSPLERT